ncbi:MAG: MerR family transcriptional regulator [Acidimicrobiales bacterium]
MSEQVTPADDYLKPSEVARILHVSPKTVDRWANEGRIACIVTLGGHRRFSRADVAAAAEEMRRRGRRDPSDD